MTTIPVEALLQKKERFERGADRRSLEDPRAELLHLEEQGELLVQKIQGDVVTVPTKYGREKRIQKGHLWHHKSCGQCGHIPGYSTSIFWVMRKLGYDYHDPRDQTSCTAWNYYASATSNVAAQAAVAVRNFAAAAETGYFPLVHCGTSYGHYKEVREELLLHPELRAEVREIMGKLGKELVFPEELVHYSEWFYAMRDEIAALQTRDLSGVRVTVHPACHYYKLVEGDAIYDPDVYGGQRTAVVTGLAQRLGADVREYSTWFDCCGFGFRHILVQRDFTRSFATMRKIEVMKEEADPDVVLTHDTGCVTTLDKSQFAAKAHERNVGVAVMSEAQFAALAMGAHPYKVCQLHWHSADYRPLLEKMGIDWEQAWAEFQEGIKKLEKGEKRYLDWDDVD
ncbi:heterodisulfide reductase subunit B [Amycolatopsis sp. K13G38]|uniref:Heterodisulfide reductase subunit B n=1 Tax=Amycolatopsis acididurans TaxID=2724524 RepID=A0ABX1J3L0_9PSEU|nr:heterodisulfide reductase-related iron-sulfur binding cluster [Amycolatopsis acididurans]NKQ54390.1 heterodisulfide reductase subunit B [Amycolatopsis acididurans]